MIQRNLASTIPVDGRRSPAHSEGLQNAGAVPLRLLMGDG
jgi:hypothetical protein